MFSTLRTRFGIPGVISVIALVFAMFGGAYAASNSSDGGGKATASAKAKKGPRGPKGATGPSGPAGPQGLAGAKGDAGASGSNGSAGAAGASGKSVVIGTLNPGSGGCSEGGTSVEVAGEPATKKSICNGEEGAPGNAGANGSPWTAGGTLPSGETETGAWSFGGTTATVTHVSISFPIPLATALGTGKVHLINLEGDEVKKFNFGTQEEEEIVPPTECLGSVAEPTASPGNLCVYTAEAGGPAKMASSLIVPPSTFGVVGTDGAGTTGARLTALALGGEGSSTRAGTWAMTAP